MRPSDRTIRDVLRREAANVPIPDDMWKNISRELDRDVARVQRRKQLAHQRGQWRPALILAVAAGFFWFALIPALPPVDTAFPSESAVKAPWVPAGRPDPHNTPAKATPEGYRRDIRETAVNDSPTSVNVMLPYHMHRQY